MTSRLRAARQAGGLTQEALGERAGVHPVHVSDLERGRKAVGVRVALRLADALGVAVDDLLDGLGPRWPVAPWLCRRTLSDLRRARGLTQRGLASASGVLDKTISAVETGRAFPPARSVALS